MTAAISFEVDAAFAALHETIKRTEDPEQRQLALLTCYGSTTRAHAAAFLDDLLTNEDLGPGEDLAVRAQAIVDAILDILIAENAKMGLGFAEFENATRHIVSTVFFHQLNSRLSLALEPPQGTS